MALPSDTGTVSVPSFRNRFEQKQAPSTKVHSGPSPRHDGAQPSEEGVKSVASARAMFEQQSVKKSPPPWKQSNRNQSKSGSACVDENSNVDNLKEEPPRKVLPPLFRIGAAPPKPAKPDHLKLRLRRFQEKIILSTGADSSARTSKEEEEFEETEEIYDDVASVIQERHGDLISIYEEFLEETKEETYIDVGSDFSRNQASISKVNHASSGFVTTEGGSVSVNGVTLTCPAGALDDFTTIKLKLEEPHKYCGLLVQRGLENVVIFDTPIVNCQPNGQKFKEYLELTIALDSEQSKSADTAIVLHGTRTSEGKYSWEDITHNSNFDSKKGEIKVEINHFSLIAVLLRLTWVHTKEIVTRLNLMSFKYMLSVLYKSNQQNLPYDELALVFMSHDIYREQFYREHDDSALMQLKRNGFEELGSNVGQEINYVYNKETLTVSIHLGEDYKPANNQQECITFTVESSVWWSTGHVIKLPLRGSAADTKILCGRIAVQGQYGHVREDHFCQLDLCGYVRRLLGVENVIFNLKPVAQKLELPEETLNQVVACWQSEAKQLEMILLHWREKQRDTEDLAVLRKALTGLDPDEYKVKERGQMHIEHLRELTVTIAGLQHNDPNMMKYLGFEIKKLCNSVLRDCCIEIATSKEDLDLVSSTENCASLLAIHRQIYEDLAKKCKHMCLSSEEAITGNFLMIVPQLVQAIKEIFRDERIPAVQNGLRGVAEETTNKITDHILQAAQAKSILRLVSEVCKILEHLCHNNNDNRSTETEIRNWGGCAMIVVMLYFLERFFLSNEARRMYKRLEILSASVRDIMSNPAAFEGNFLHDFHNVALSLLKFAKFDPSQLVRFELTDPTNSSNTHSNDELKYEKSQEVFSQLFWISKECEDELQLEAVARVHIDGHVRSIGAFESQITLPASCSGAIDRVPIASLSIAVKRQQDDSGNLRVTLYATKKENVGMALKYLENELGRDVVDLKQTEIIQSHLKVRSRAKAGTVVRLRLVHKWGSETLVLESSDFVALADSSAGGACAPEQEIAAETGKLAIKTELPALPTASGSTVDNYCSNFVMDASDADLVQRHLRKEHGRVEINYNQIFMQGRVCVAGDSTNLNNFMQESASGQRLASCFAEPLSRVNFTRTEGTILELQCRHAKGHSCHGIGSVGQGSCSMLECFPNQTERTGNAFNLKVWNCP
ncbi:hypothetical protein ACROYT_G023792 [Oculina patagonica]